jgi:hypothetical protein
MVIIMSSSLNNLHTELTKLASDYGDLSLKEAGVKYPRNKNGVSKEREALQKRVEELIHRPGIHFGMLSTEQYQGLFAALLVVNRLAFDDEALATNQPSKIIHHLAQKYLNVEVPQEPKIKTQIRELLKANDAAGLEKFITAADLSILSTKEIYLLLSTLKAKFTIQPGFKKVFVWVVNNVLAKKDFDPSIDWNSLKDIDLKDQSPLALHSALKAINDKNGIIALDKIKHLNDQQLSLIYRNYFHAFVKHAKEQIKKDAEAHPKAFREFFDLLLNHPNVGPLCAGVFTDFITNDQNALKVVQTMAEGGLGLQVSIANSRIVRFLTKAQFRQIIDLPLKTGKSPLADKEGIGTLTLFCTNYFKHGKEGKAAFHDFLEEAVLDNKGSTKPHLRSLINYAVNTPFFKEYLDEQQIRTLVLNLLKQLEPIEKNGELKFVLENLKQLLTHPKANAKLILKDLIDRDTYTAKVGKELTSLMSEKERYELQSIMEKHEASLKMREIQGAG